MYLSKEKKVDIFQTFGKTEYNTGCSEAQVALFTFRIKHLTEHLKQNKKDFNTQHALVKLVGKRRKLLNYLKRKEIQKYRFIIKSLASENNIGNIYCLQILVFFFRKSFLVY